MTYDERLQHLLATAANIFAAHGFHSTTMRDLSRATGMSLAGMYYYVEGKDELLFLIQERCFTEILTGARAAIAAETYPLERLRRFIRHHVGFFTAHMAEMKVLSHEAESLSGERWETINRLKRTYVVRTGSPISWPSCSCWGSCRRRRPPPNRDDGHDGDDRKEWNVTPKPLDPAEQALIARINDGLMIETVADMTPGYKKALLTQLTVQGDTELMSAPAYYLAARDAPTINSRIAVTAIVHDELGHANIAYRIMEDLGADKRQLVYGRQPHEFKHPYGFDQPLENSS